MPGVGVTKQAAPPGWESWVNKEKFGRAGLSSCHIIAHVAAMIR